MTQSPYGLHPTSHRKGGGYFLASATRRSSEGTTDRAAESCQEGMLHERTRVARDLEDAAYTRHARLSMLMATM